MASRYLMGLDVGGGSGRCLLVDVDTGAMAFGVRSWSHPVAPGTGGWGLDLDTDTIWERIGEAARQALARAGVAADQVEGLAVTSMRHGTVLVGADDDVLWAVPNRDARAAAEALELASTHGGVLLSRTGHWPSPIAQAARLRWLITHHPALLERTRVVLSVSDWLAWRLSGELASDASQAGETSLLDLQTRAWADDLFGALSLPRERMPNLRPAGDLLGGLRDEAAAHLGLRPGTPVAVGGADTQCGLLGAGVTEPGQVGVVAGTTVPIQQVISRPVADPERRLWTGAHVLADRWVLESNAGAAGQALDWLGELLSPGDTHAAGALCADANASQPSACGISSTLGAELFHASQMGLPIANLTFSHLSAGIRDAPRRHLSRAVLEGLAYAVRANLAQITEISAQHPETLRVAGGLSRSPTWCGIVADVCGIPVEVPATHQASLVGAAICAGVGAGVFPSLAAGAASLSRVERRHEPDPARVGVYQSLFDDWLLLRDVRTGADAQAAEMVLRAASDVDDEAVRPPTPGDDAFRPHTLVTAPLDDGALARLRRLGEVEYAPYMERQRVLTGDDLVDALQGFQVLVTEVDIVDAEALAGLPDLRVVHTCRSNPVNVDVDACTAYGVPVMNAPGRNSLAVAEITVALLLMLARKLVEADRFLHAPGGEAGDLARMGMAHERFEGFEIGGKTVGLVGLGAVGREVAARLKPFGVRLVVADPFLSEEEAALAAAEILDLETRLREADLVSLHAPVTDETRGMLGESRLARMKRGACLVNTARSALVDADALEAALRSGHLGGAALDVFATEPPAADDPLLALPNVIATPHIAGNTRDVARHQGEMVAEAVERLVGGGRPAHVVNPEVLDGFRWTGERRAPSADEAAALAGGAGPAVSDLEVDDEEEPAPTPGKKGIWSGLKSLVTGSTGAAEDGESPAGTGSGEPLQDDDSPRGMLLRILHDFCGRVAEDGTIQGFSKSKKITVQYVVPDAEITFYMRFVGLPVECGLGDLPDRAVVTLKMNAEVLDAVFMERIGGMKAAMSGKLAFAGNTMKAMSLQRIQKDLNRLYREAREHVGDPGDLESFGPPEGAERADEGPDGVTPTTTGSPPSPTARAVHVPRVDDERDEMFDIVRELVERDLITSTGGNVSMRRPEHPEEVWITPSSLPKGGLRPDLFVRVGLDGEPLDPTSLAPSSERLMHCTILRDRPDVNAVIHSHAPRAIILGMAGLPFLPISTEAAFFGEIPRVPFQMPGTEELAEEAVAAMGDKPAVMLVNHGLLVAGSSIRRAMDLTEIVEQTADALIECHKLGIEPPVLPDEVVEMLRSLGELIA